MIVESFYLSDESNIPKALELTGLSIDELSGLTGRFNKNSHRAGQMRGEIVIYIDGKVVIRNSFTKKSLWESESAVVDFDERF